MLHVGLDFSRKRVDYCALDPGGMVVEVGAGPAECDRWTKGDSSKARGLSTATKRRPGSPDPGRLS